MNTLFIKKNLELEKMTEMVSSKQIVTKYKKTAFSLHDKHTQKVNLPVALQILRINGVELKRKVSIKLLEVLFFLFSSISKFTHNY